MIYQHTKGFSLFEIVIVLALLSIIMPSFFQLVVISQKAIAYGRQKSASLVEGISRSHILQKNMDYGAIVTSSASCTTSYIDISEKRTDCVIYVDKEIFTTSSFQMQ